MNMSISDYSTIAALPSGLYWVEVLDYPKESYYLLVNKDTSVLNIRNTQYLQILLNGVIYSTNDPEINNYPLSNFKKVMRLGEAGALTEIYSRGENDVKEDSLSEESPVVYLNYRPEIRSTMFNGVYYDPITNKPFTAEELAAYKEKYPDDLELYVAPDPEYGPWNRKFKVKSYIVGPSYLDKIRSHEDFEPLDQDLLDDMSKDDCPAWIIGYLKNVPVVLCKTFEPTFASEPAFLKVGNWVRGTTEEVL